MLENLDPSDVTIIILMEPYQSIVRIDSLKVHHEKVFMIEFHFSQAGFGLRVLGIGESESESLFHKFSNFYFYFSFM